MAHAFPRVTDRALGMSPAEFGFSAHSVPVTLQVRFDFVKLLAVMLSLGFPPILVCGSVLIVVFALADVRTLAVVAPPVFVFDGGINLFGDRFAGQAPGYSTDGGAYCGPDSGPDGTSYRSHGCTCCGTCGKAAGGGPHARTDWMCPAFPTERVAILVAMGGV